MPEGDSLHRAARRLQVLVGERVAVETPHPRASAERLAERLDGRRLESVEAVGKNLLLSFEGGLVLRSHLRMRGRWQVRARDSKAWVGSPWLVLRGPKHEAVLWNGPVLELTGRAVRRLGPDILADPPDFARMVENLWKAEARWRARVSPWLRLGEASDELLHGVLGEAARLMRASVVGGREERAIYRRAGRPCPRCGEPIRSRGQGDDNRTAYWCPGCQRGKEPRFA